jgi:hypothetical protein
MKGQGMQKVCRNNSECLEDLCRVENFQRQWKKLEEEPRENIQIVLKGFTKL